MKVLLTGANGYIGRRLKKHLMTQDVDLRLLVRNPKTIENYLQRKMKVFKGDTWNVPNSVDKKPIQLTPLHF